MSTQAPKTLFQRIEKWFPEREFFMRAQGQVRFITLTSRFQVIVASIIAAALLGWAISMAAMAILQYQAQANAASLLEREAKVADSDARIEAYGDDIGKVAEDLKRRQDFLDQMSAAIPDDVKRDATHSDSSSEAAATVEKVSAAIPEAKGLAEIEARQIAYVEKMTRFADERAARASAAIRRLGLNPATMLKSAREAQGGPLEKFNVDDPRFERLGLSLARLDALERGLEGIPQFMPADKGSISSGFGYRRDPFNGGGAMHSGLDFRAPYGSPIYAAADGVISYVGYKGGYGKTVEISHGNGLMTRYAHMSRYSAQVGQRVAAGRLIGSIGSTGRSTGPHLHFEVRVNNRAVNPRPFLERAPHVLKEARRSTQTNRASGSR